MFCYMITYTPSTQCAAGVVAALVVARIGVTPATLGIQLGLCNVLELVIGAVSLKFTLKQVLKVIQQHYLLQLIN
jgi:ribose/xylose/arabinose/galactoside ABC-type transport system permease subunit